ncbi:hypothetical protein DFH94DRAFT_788689 [Russula ochroleuca]|uniref:Uncharacterized protein n=1 Tax=Russula ochroleuca TaxID=152965 RepID=A0A9P5JTF4_9AGAM|nr:hypothetical protein DFH94DRAFT_788689 [Russula ochroleuca]
MSMSNDTWQAIGNIASTTGITAVAYSGVKGVVASYQTYASPSTSLKESERKLKRVRSQLNGLTSERREQIEIATRSRSSDPGCLSLGGLEIQLQALLDTYCRLSKRYEEATFTERHFPYSEFRHRVSRLEDRAKALLNDTLKTTVPFVDDIEFDHENLRVRPFSTRSPLADA